MNSPIEDVYTVIKRIAAFFLGVALLGISIWFSAEGLNFNMQESFIFGIVIALAVTTFEFIFDEDGFKGSLTMAIIGLFAYGYGIFSNYYGIWVRQGMPEDVIARVFAGIFAVFIEVAPEQLILWALGLTGRGIRDMLSNFANGGRGIASNFNSRKDNGNHIGHGGGERFNPSQAHQERIMREHGLGNQGQQSPFQGKKKKKGGSWKPGMPGRPPKGFQKVPGLEKILNQGVKDE